MKCSIKIIIILMACCLIISCGEKPIATDIQGNVIKLSNYKGKWVVLNYWANWCEPCYEEIPQLNAFYVAHKEHDAIVLGINYDALPLNQLKAFATQQKVLYPILTSDPGAQLGITRIPSLPATYIISPNGTLREQLLGPQSKASLELAMSLPHTSSSQQSNQK